RAAVEGQLLGGGGGRKPARGQGDDRGGGAKTVAHSSLLDDFVLLSSTLGEIGTGVERADGGTRLRPPRARTPVRVPRREAPGAALPVRSTGHFTPCVRACGAAKPGHACHLRRARAGV